MTRTIEGPWLQVDQPAILRYAQLTGDFNPIHVDAPFAATTPFGHPIAHGTLAINLVLDGLEEVLGGQRLRDVTVNARFIKPVFAGDYVRLEAVQRSDGEWVISIRNENRVTVIDGILVLAGNC